jgi:hypothetical protein
LRLTEFVAQDSASAKSLMQMMLPDPRLEGTKGTGSEGLAFGSG